MFKEVQNCKYGYTVAKLPEIIISTQVFEVKRIVRNIPALKMEANLWKSQRTNQIISNQKTGMKKATTLLQST